MHNFVTSCIGYLGNSGSLTFADLPNVDKFHCIKYIKHYLYYHHHQSHQKSTGSHFVHNGGHKFSNILIFHLKTSFIIGSKYC